MSDPNDPSPIRVMVFPERPDAILIYVPDGQELWLPRIRAPFDRHEVASILGQSDIPARVAESVPGRWTTALREAMTKSKNDAASRSRQAQREAQAAKAVEIQYVDGEMTTATKRALLVEDKNKIDDELRALKAALGHAKSKAYVNGVFMPIEEFRVKERQIHVLQTKSIALQHELGVLKKQLKAENIVKTAAIEKTRAECFMSVVHRHLDAEEIRDLWEEVDEMLESGAAPNVTSEVA